MRQRPEAVCTIILIAVNVAVFFILSLFGDTEDAVFMMQHGAMYSDFVIQDHEYYRLFTCLFLHFGIEHLLNNMVILGALGPSSQMAGRQSDEGRELNLRLQDALRPHSQLAIGQTAELRVSLPTQLDYLRIARLYDVPLPKSYQPIEAVGYKFGVAHPKARVAQEIERERLLSLADGGQEGPMPAPQDFLA